MIVRLIPLLALLLPSVAHAEDAAHRADRLRTQALNQRAAAAVARRDHGNARQRESYRAARDRYERQMADWRARVADCRAGYYDACDGN